MNIVYDAIIVGGGIVGISIAYHLVLNGSKTLLFDRQDVGRATDAAAGVIGPYTAPSSIGYGSDALFNIGVEAAEYYPTLIEELGADSTIYDRCGVLKVAVSEDEIQQLEEQKSLFLKRQEQIGHLSFPSYHEAKELFPPLAPIKGAIYTSKAARVDGRRLSHILYQSAEKQRLTVKSLGVESLIIESGKVRGVVANGDNFYAKKVAIAGGAWSRAFEQQLGISIPVEPQRAQIVHLSLPHVKTANWPILVTFRVYYILSWPDGRLVVGATKESGSGFNPHTTIAGIQEILGETLRVAPQLKDAQLLEVRVGLRPMTPDLLPVLGTVPKLENLYLATGHGYSGLLLGPYSGKLVAQMMLDNQPETDLAAFDVTRFSP